MAETLKKEVVVGQTRHSLNTLGGLIAGTALASTDQVQAVMTLLDSAGLSPELQAAIGAMVLLVAHGLSWLNKMKRKSDV